MWWSYKLNALIVNLPTFRSRDHKRWEDKSSGEGIGCRFPFQKIDRAVDQVHYVNVEDLSFFSLWPYSLIEVMPLQSFQLGQTMVEEWHQMLIATAFAD